AAGRGCRPDASDGNRLTRHRLVLPRASRAAARRLPRSPRAPATASVRRAEARRCSPVADPEATPPGGTRSWQQQILRRFIEHRCGDLMASGRQVRIVRKEKRPRIARRETVDQIDEPYAFVRRKPFQHVLIVLAGGVIEDLLERRDRYQDERCLVGG